MVFNGWGNGGGSYLGVQFLYFLGVVIVLSGFLGLIITRSYIISLFLCLELIVVGLLTLMAVYSLFSLESNWSSLCLLLLCVNACEASAGLALIVSVSRSHGSTSLSNVNLLIS
nr:NADH dehydrogenase subunit 4L [Euapta godeffroyi]